MGGLSLLAISDYALALPTFDIEGLARVKRGIKPIVATPSPVAETAP